MEGRRRREESMVEMRKRKREEPSPKNRHEGLHAQQYPASVHAFTTLNEKVAALQPRNMASRTLPEKFSPPGHSHPTKVYSISSTTENKEVSVSESHEVPRKSSTDGIASAGIIGNLSRDALSKQKIALQKKLAEKQKQLPLSNKPASPKGSRQMGSKEGFNFSFHLPGFLPKAVSASNFEIKYAQELAAKLEIQPDTQFPPLLKLFSGQMPSGITYQNRPAKAPILRLDTLGREIDEHGNVVDATKVTNLSTLKVNINKQKKEAFQPLRSEFEVDPGRSSHFDARIKVNSRKHLRRSRTCFQFVEEGTWSKEAEIIKLKSQFGEAQAIELKAKQTRLAKSEPGGNPNLIEVSERVSIKGESKEPIPEVEWWDHFLLLYGSYGDVTDGNTAEGKLNLRKITIYIEHPSNLPTTEQAPSLPQLLKPTKEERRKLRKQQRQARENHKQAMIAQGLTEPPKPNVKMNNLMKILGCEATQVPTRLEMEIRRAANERKQAHEDRNATRKLTPCERREKREMKLFGYPDVPEFIVSEYKVHDDLSYPQTQFKVNVNAHENWLTGCAVVWEGTSVVVVEGGKKSIKRYQNLMLRRMDWDSAVEKGDEDEGKTVNKCVLVWEVSVAKRSFDKFCVHNCRTEAAARKVFSDAGVSHYWDHCAHY